jgi:hypothetical protein
MIECYTRGMRRTICILRIARGGLPTDGVAQQREVGPLEAEDDASHCAAPTIPIAAGTLSDSAPAAARP